MRTELFETCRPLARLNQIKKTFIKNKKHFFMGHMIDNSKGFNAFMAVGAAAWHGLGKIYTEEEGKRLTAEQVLVDSGNEFNVIKLPNVHIIPATGEEIISKDSFFTLRTDVNKILGSRLGPQYEVLQNKESFEVVNDILQAGKATIESAGVIDEGRKTFICLKIDKNIFLDSQDVIKQYALIVNSHDGTVATSASTFIFRVLTTSCAFLPSCKALISSPVKNRFPK